jgi:hypothetical protein
MDVLSLRLLQRALSAGAVLCGLALASSATVADDGNASAWKQVKNPASVTGLDGKRHAAACSGYPGTDPAFSFWHKRGKSKNLVVYFEGGGACWDNFSCTFPIDDRLPAQVPQLYVPQVPANSNPSSYSGIFDAKHPANPVKNWSFVYIPYCTGDVHNGSADRPYFNAGHPVFPLPSMFQIHHGGFDNFMVVLDWMRKNADQPEQILVAGSSAGGYGASTNFPWVQKAFPKAKMAVLADASQGVLSPTFDASMPGRNSWNPQLAPWVFGNDVDVVSSGSILRTAAKALPKVRVGQFTTTFDAVQIQFYGVSLLTNPAFPSCPIAGADADTVVAASWNHDALAGLKTSAATAPNYRHYLAAGQYHTILRSPQFYSEDSAGVRFADWTTALLQYGEGDGDDDRRGGKHSAWQNVACPGCLVSPFPCP